MRDTAEMLSDLVRQKMATDAFIQCVNADHADVVTVYRGFACLIRHEILRLRKIERAAEGR